MSKKPPKYNCIIPNGMQKEVFKMKIKEQKNNKN